ncbi:MAG: hypothetical protein JXB36_09590 [Gammaproteobacteria bacterium]|nr:hypothetical protein [Gammaproteobacteria bacterium]
MFSPSNPTLRLQLVSSIAVVWALIETRIGVMSLMFAAAGMVYVVIAAAALRRSAIAVGVAAVTTVVVGTLAAAAAWMFTSAGFDWLSGTEPSGPGVPAVAVSPTGDAVALPAPAAMPEPQFEPFPYLALLIAVLSLVVTYGHVRAWRRSGEAAKR